MIPPRKSPRPAASHLQRERERVRLMISPACAKPRCAFTIHARDAAGNHIQEGGLVFTVNIKPVFATGARAAKVQTEVRTGVPRS